MEEAAVLEAPVTSTPVETGGETSSQGDISSQEPVSSTQQPTDKTDRRNNPDALRKTLKWLRENGGEHSAQAQELEKRLGELKSWRTVAQNVREAREMKATFDAIGGSAKIAELQTYATSMQEVDAMLEAGDPQVVDKIFETGAKGIAKILPRLIEKLGETNPQDVANAVKPHVTGFLDSEGLPDAIDAMVAAFNAGKPDDAKGILAKIVNWYKGLGAKGSVSADKPPEQAAWEKERDQFHQKAFSTDVEKAFTASMSHAETVIDKELSLQGKEYGLTPEVLSIVRSDVWKRIEKERNNDPVFKSTINTKVNERTRKVDPSTVDFLKSQVDSRVKDAVRQELRLRYGFVKAKPADPNVKTNVTAAPTTAAISIDYGKTQAKYGSRQGAQDAIMNGKAVNSAGKPIVKVGKVWKLA